ncbi:MAG: SocA family protein [Candidatus Latescibacteria bacterium]|nr:SocA family protein [Candidatus Latescibacterota bacterium]
MAKKTPVQERFAGLVRLILTKVSGIRTVQFVKLIYFSELEYYIKFGEPATEVPIIRLPMGPVPSNYKGWFAKLEEEKFIKTSCRHKGKSFSPGPNTACDHVFTEIELEVFLPVIAKCSEIIKANLYNATEIIKGLSYQTLPMIRYTEQEEKTGLNLGGYVLAPPYLTEADLDSMAESRRVYRDHLGEANPYSKEGAERDLEVWGNFLPFLQATNQGALNRKIPIGSPCDRG